MFGAIGVVIVIALVFGGYIASGGKLYVIIKALPYELTMIGGAAVGAFLIGNSIDTIKQTLRSFKKIFQGSKWSESHYTEALCLLFELLRLQKQNPIAIEEHIESPNESTIFSRYPNILGDHESVELICDTLRAASMNYDDPRQVEDLLDKRLDSNIQHELHPSHALQTTADALPALGIVAAVLGVIKTMSSIDQPPEVLGKLIGGALVGTFLGVFLAYGFVGPFAAKLRSTIEEEAQFYHVIREVLVANLYGHSTNICIEVGRQTVPHELRVKFADLENELKSIKHTSLV